jgi:hypothetical protein
VFGGRSAESDDIAVDEVVSVGAEPHDGNLPRSRRSPELKEPILLAQAAVPYENTNLAGDSGSVGCLNPTCYSDNADRMRVDSWRIVCSNSRAMSIS